MTRVLIATFPEDLHATIVAESLAERGHEAVLWQGADFPTRQQASVWLGNGEGPHWRVSGPGLAMDSSRPFDVVWQRRPVIDPVLPESMHPGDGIVARRECTSFTKSLWQLISPAAFWVNPLTSRQRATSKLVQLEAALAEGLRVPQTLSSNDPDEIRVFLDRYPGRTIYKPFYPALWEQPEASALLFTSAICKADLPPDDVLRLTPGIFQERIDRDHELRLTYMGELLVAAKLLVPEPLAAQLDCKLAFGSLQVMPAEVPGALDRACRGVLARLGIVFGCIDIIVTPQGEHVFLEVNEMGQFLGLEEHHPDFRLLDPFCEMLAQARPNFTWQRSRNNLHYAEMVKRAEARQQEVLVSMHVARPRVFSVCD